jgi:adenosylcobinamide-GDP ribazoletransferase
MTAGLSAWFVAKRLGITALVVTGALTWVASRLAVSRISGLTGDVYGAICELLETLTVLILATGDRG